VLIVVVGNAVSAFLITIAFRYSLRTALTMAAALSQIGEFSFILGQSGLALGLIDNDQYSLILAGAIVSITVNPLMFRLVNPAERLLKRWPAVWRWMDQVHADIPVSNDTMHDHVVIVGCGRVGRHIAEALGRLQIPRIVVESDPSRLTKLHELGVPVLYGDAGSSEILEHAGLATARALVITLPDDAAAMAVATTARKRAPELRIVSRASTWDGARRLKSAGVNDVVRPELEGGVEIVRRTLLDLDLPLADVQRYAEVVRREGLDETERPSADRARLLDQLVDASGGLEVTWIEVEPGNAMAGRTIGESGLRKRTGASIVGIARQQGVQVNPGPDDRMDAGDRLAVIGTIAQTQAAMKLLAGGADATL
jgi:CPA2 family monovalent cation:H+ antiporter-2